MKVLVTGSDGQLAKDLIPLLDIAGYETLSFNYAALDITDKEAVLKAVEISSPEIIINCASYTQVDKAEEESELAFQVNGEGAANMADAALTSNALLIHISTDFVFDGLKSTPYTELDATNPLSIYGKSKLKGEDEILKEGVRLCDYPHLLALRHWRQKLRKDHTPSREREDGIKGGRRSSRQPHMDNRSCQ